jgi:CheY-like chemotaxis protein
MKILVVEDILLNQLLMRTLLDDFGFDCQIASNGKIAIENMYASTYDLVLMDLQMPEMNGFETALYIRNQMNSSIPIIALTADVTKADLAKCKEAGMNDYLAKPVNEKLLYSKIMGLVKKSAKNSLAISPSVNKPEELSAQCINLSYLSKLTKEDPVLMAEMISLYLEQTPVLIESMRDSFQKNNWIILHSSVHKLIPSFSIMGINEDFGQMAFMVKDYEGSIQHRDSIAEMVIKLECVCNQACNELQAELVKLKSVGYEKPE